MALKVAEKESIEEFGKKIRNLRTSKKLSMQTLANLADIELSQVHRIETGKINPKLITILRLAKALNISVETLFKGF
jgi:transcriptional regulator with XRE-family HTH domain